MNDKIVVGKNPNARYVGLENLVSGSPDIASWSPATTSISTNGVFREGDTLFGKLRPNLRKCVLAPFNGYCSTDILVLRAREGVAPRFASRVLQSDAVFDAAVLTAVGTKMPRTSWHALRHRAVFAPPLPEQRQIAAVLDTLDDAIRKTEQILAKLKQVKQGLLHDLLTRGIDDNGELRDPERHPEQFKDSPLGRIPKGWEVGGLMDVGASDRQAILTGPFGAQLGSQDFVTEGVPVLRIGNVQWGHLDLADLLFVRAQKATAMDRWRVRAGDLLFARQGATTGRNALATEHVDGAVINYHIIRVAFDTAKCHPMFMCALFNSPIVQEQADREKGRGTREGVNTTTLTSFILPLPTKGEQDQLAKILETHDKKIKAEDQSCRKLGLLKSGLMEDLLTGRVRVTPLLEATTP